MAVVQYEWFHQPDEMTTTVQTSPVLNNIHHEITQSILVYIPKELIELITNYLQLYWHRFHSKTYESFDWRTWEGDRVWDTELMVPILTVNFSEPHPSYSDVNMFWQIGLVNHNDRLRKRSHYVYRSQATTAIRKFIYDLKQENVIFPCMFEYQENLRANFNSYVIQVIYDINKQELVYQLCISHWVYVLCTYPGIQPDFLKQMKIVLSSHKTVAMKIRDVDARFVSK